MACHNLAEHAELSLHGQRLAMPSTLWKSPFHLASDMLNAVLVESLLDADCRGRGG